MPEPQDKKLKADKITSTISPRSPLYRGVRKRELLRFIYTKMESDENLDVAKLLGVFSWKWGISMKTIEAYIDEFKIMGAIKIVAERITITKIGKRLLEGAI